MSNTHPDAQRAFEEHLAAMPDWAPEFEVHRPWVEKLLREAWDAATERAAKIADDKAERINSRWIAQDIATAIRSSGRGELDNDESKEVS